MEERNDRTETKSGITEGGAANKAGFATLIGRPNVGKSTLMNHLIGQKIAITSKKPQTTRNRIQTVYTGERGQIVFLDTPGIHHARNKLGEYMVRAAESALNDVDVILWLVEPTTYLGVLEKEILEKLQKSAFRKGTPVILVINKTDTCDKEQLALCIDHYRKQADFAEIVPVSALKAHGLSELLDCIFKYLPYGENFYDSDAITNQPERVIVSELIREKALRLLNEEVPHGVAVNVDTMQMKKELVEINATIVCEKASHKGIIIGRNGAMLKKIGTEARKDIEALLDMHVNLKLWVKVKKDWRDSGFLLQDFGYDQKEL